MRPGGGREEDTRPMTARGVGGWASSTVWAWASATARGGGRGRGGTGGWVEGSFFFSFWFARRRFVFRRCPAKKRAQTRAFCPPTGAHTSHTPDPHTHPLVLRPTRARAVTMSWARAAIASLSFSGFVGVCLTISGACAWRPPQRCGCMCRVSLVPVAGWARLRYDRFGGADVSDEKKKKKKRLCLRPDNLKRRDTRLPDRAAACAGACRSSHGPTHPHAHHHPVSRRHPRRLRHAPAVLPSPRRRRPDSRRQRRRRQRQVASDCVRVGECRPAHGGGDVCVVVVGNACGRAGGGRSPRAPGTGGGWHCVWGTLLWRSCGGGSGRRKE